MNNELEDEYNKLKAKYKRKKAKYREDIEELTAKYEELHQKYLRRKAQHREELEKLKDKHDNLEAIIDEMRNSFSDLLNLIKEFREAEENYYYSMADKMGTGDKTHYIGEMMELRDKLFRMVDDLLR